MRATRNILIVDDEKSIRKFLKVGLEMEGYNIFEASSVHEAIQYSVAHRPDLMILDLGLPDGDGLDVLNTIREWSAIPVIVLTVKEDEQNKVKALDSGADDYLTKPFSMPELLARLRVAWRHGEKEGAPPVFRSGPLEVDIPGHIVKLDGNVIRMTATEFAILKLLIKHAGKVVTHRQILKEIWGPNSVDQTQYIRVYVGHLRKKIEPYSDSTRIIQTEPGVGYCLLEL